jgi:hypothetical protein
MEFSTEGYAYTVFSPKDKHWVDEHPDYSYLCDVELPIVDNEMAIDVATRGIERKKAEIAREKAACETRLRIITEGQL